MVLSDALRRATVVALAATAGAVFCASGRADSTAKTAAKGHSSWEVKIVKSKTTALSRAAPPAPEQAKAAPAQAKAAPGVPSWYRPVTYADLPGWAGDNHLEAYNTFLKSCGRVISRGRDRATKAKGPPPPSAALVAACVEAKRLSEDITGRQAARAFFEANFTPHAVAKRGKGGMVTGYYEPVLLGSRTPEGRFRTPIYKRPPELVNVVDDTRRGMLKPGALTHVRKTRSGTEPYFTRADIDKGALKGRGLELLYLADAVDVFFMQIQGSGRIKLTDGSTVRVHYDGKNGHPYSSIGRYLIDKAILAADRISMAALAEWLRADPERGRQVMWQNSSYVFFREIKDNVGSPLGAMRVPLTPGRSLAIDTAFHALGTPIFVSAPGLRHVPNVQAFNRLMVGQDVGSAIRGAERGDIFFGSGDVAAKIAGSTKYPARFFVLVPNGSPKAAPKAPPKVPSSASAAGPVK